MGGLGIFIFTTMSTRRESKLIFRLRTILTRILQNKFKMNRGQDQLIIIDENLSNSHFSKYCLNMKFFLILNCMSNKFQYCSFFRNRFENSSVQSIQCSGTCHSCNVLLYMKLNFSRPSIHLTRLCSVKRKNDV